MLNHIITVSAAGALALAPAAVSAQQERASPVDSFHLVQLSVNASDVAPDEFKAKTESIRSCADARDLRDSLGAEMTRNRFVRATQLPDDLRALVDELPTGHATPVYTYDGAVLRVLVLCNRV